MFRPQVFILYLLLVLSGAAGLGYEMVWTRMLAVGLGHEIPAVLAVMSAFFGGLAAGSFLFDGPVSRSRVPGRWYVAFELTIGLWSIVLIGLIPLANRAVGHWIGVAPSPLRQWLIAFTVPFVLLLPATAAMGGTLPSMDRLVARLRQSGQCIPGLYAANTLGAVLGTLLATLVIVPQLGFTSTLVILAIINFLCALGVLAAGCRRPGATRAPSSIEPAMPDAPLFSARLILTLLLTGLLGIGYEVLVIRVLSQVLENTVYTFAVVLSVYLLGTAAGAATYQALASVPSQRLTTHLMQALSATCLLGLILLAKANDLYQWAQTAAGGGFSGSLIAEAVLAAAVFFLPTLAMGATFSHLLRSARSQRGGVGMALGINTVGAAFASAIFGVWLLPQLGSKLCLAVVGLGYLPLMPRSTWRAMAWSVAPIVLAGWSLFGQPPLRHVRIPDGGSLASYQEGVMAAVIITADQGGGRHLSVNNAAMGGTRSRFPDLRQAHIPLLLHGNPKTALFLGLGTGTTFAGAGYHPGLDATGVELVPEIVPILHHFETHPGEIVGHPRLHIAVADARRYVNAVDQRYDVIVADLFHPGRDGSGSLYTIEHFQAIRSHLNDDGLFCQWLPLYQLDLEILRVITRTFLEVFPQGSMWLCHNSVDSPIIGLIGRRSATGLLLPSAGLAQRLGHQDPLRSHLMRVNLADDYALLGSYLAGHDELSAWSASAPVNSDDQPVVIFNAPRFTYAPAEPASTRLLALLDRFHPKPRDVITSAKQPDEAVERRLAACWDARVQFLRGMAASTVDRQLSLMQSSLSRSSDFADSYFYLLSRVIPAIGKSDRAAARRLLLELQNAHPQRPEAAALLQQQFASPAQ